MRTPKNNWPAFSEWKMQDRTSDMSFNSLKSQCISVGYNWNYKAADLTLDDNAIQWANKLKYLGVTIMSGRSFSLCLDRTRQKYFASANGLNAHWKYVSEPVKSQLFVHQFLSIVLIVLVYLSNRYMNLTCVGIMPIEKCFGFKAFEPAKELIYFMQCIDFRQLYDLRRLTFLHKLVSLQHDIISNLL